MKTLISGGALGADTVFEVCASNNNIDVKIMSFDGHNFNKATEKSVIVNMNQLNTIEEGLYYLVKANKTLKRSIPKPEYKRNLLLRNYCQISKTGLVIAVAKLNPYTNTVYGGTAWAVQMALDREIPVYLYDMSNREWIKLNTFTHVSSVEVVNVMNLFDNVTGIGSRNITIDATNEIKNLFKFINLN